MGTLYYVTCLDCKITRDLHKFRAFRAACVRGEASLIASEIESEYGFHAALLVSFMAQHRGHNCTAYSDQDAFGYDLIPDESEPNGFEADLDFWEPESGWTRSFTRH